MSKTSANIVIPTGQVIWGRSALRPFIDIPLCAQIYSCSPSALRPDPLPKTLGLIVAVV